MKKIKIVAIMAIFLGLCGHTRAEDYLSGWTEATGSIPSDVSSYYFAFVSMSDANGLMMGTGLNGSWDDIWE
ncbi:MAG: hypothetical protein IJQ44_04565 [Bacteroidaceae bacterium]|nr:hypothetical protein [Bacteroidaceae bacterium]